MLVVIFCLSVLLSFLIYIALYQTLIPFFGPRSIAHSISNLLCHIPLTIRPPANRVFKYDNLVTEIGRSLISTLPNFLPLL